MKPQRPIYPQRVRKKKSWADLTHLAHFTDLADLARLNVEGGMRTSCISWISCTSYISRIWWISLISQISAQKCKKSVPGEGVPT